MKLRETRFSSRSLRKMNLHDGTRGCKAPIVSGGTQAGAVPCKPRLPKQSENKISPLSNENLGLNVGIVVLRKTKLYLDKTIKVESAESTSHTGNSSYKELSVFSRAQGKGEARGCAPRPSLHRESLSLCFLCLLLGQEGRECSQPWCSLFRGSRCPWSNLPYPGAAPAQCYGAVLPHAPLDSPQWVAVCQPSHSFSERGLLFVFRWSSSWSYPSTSPGGLVCLSVFAYYHLGLYPES